ncbi:unnamed protein product [Lactuca saligna]|uniref:glycine--tRNA ligase n=1 Tax=Lactuca saligna TaxID=75948 RepID=A0AA35Y193_LACSI|nr:unnamed protein product [Lactuca saligna]
MRRTIEKRVKAEGRMHRSCAPIGYNPGSAANSTSNEDLGGSHSQFKETNVYITGQQKNLEFCNQFYRSYFVRIVQEIFDVMTDSFHKLGFKLHVLVLQHLFCMVESRSLTEPLWDTSTVSYPYPNNGMFVRDRDSTLLSFLVPLFQIFQHMRLDSLIGLFGAGCQPNSTNDPFGLPRISYGLVQVLVEKDRNLDLQHALEVDASVQSLKIDVVTICEAVGKVLPKLNGKLTGMDFRIEATVMPEDYRQKKVLMEKNHVNALHRKVSWYFRKFG